MPGEIQPLSANFAVVDDRGMPTQYFIKWAQERQIDISAGITATQAQELINAAFAARTLTAGAGLSGGGTLAADRTFNVVPGTGLQIVADQVALTDTAVAPGTYGDATHVGQFTVDQQGRLTGAASVAIAGGGGGGLVPARYWRIHGISGQDGHQGDGMGFMGIDYRDSGGTSLLGAGTPIASRTDGAWNLAQGFDGNITSVGHGWYSGSGDGAMVYHPWVGWDFGVGVTVLPATVEFAPLVAFTWTVPAQTWHEYSQDARIWHLAMLTENDAGVSGAVASYAIS